MKRKFNIYVIALLCIAMTGCNDTLVELQNQEETTKKELNCERGYLAFSSREDIGRAIEHIKKGEDFGTVPLRSSTGEYHLIQSHDFVSLLESNKRNYLNSLTPQERVVIEYDPDGLEYCMPDSIVANEYFARIVNEHRMVQVGDTIYKFIGDGILFTHKDNADALDSITQVDDPIINTGQTDEQGRFIIKLTDEVELITSTPEQAPTLPNDDGNDYGDLRLKNGVRVNDVRSTAFYHSDASNLHQFWYGLWGEYSLAINKFSEDKRMVLGFYNLDYFVYAHTGADVRMQKKVLGIWWNIKAEQIAIGWTGVELITKIPQLTTIPPIDPYLGAPNNNSNNPDYLKFKLLFQKENKFYMELPYSQIEEQNTIDDIITVAQDYATNKENVHLNNIINNSSTKTGGYTINGDEIHLFCPSDEYIVANKRTVNYNFSTQIFPIYFELGFTYENTQISKLNINIEQADIMRLGKGCVYGAVKYNGEWLGARISKYH